MRRYFAGLLLVLVVAQSSGVALADTPLQPNGAQISLESFFDPILSAIEGSQLVAQVTGTESRYAAMHAPAPRIVRSDARIDAVALLRREHGIKPTIRVGVPEHVTMPPLSALDPRHLRLDPLAMRGSNVTSPTHVNGAQIAPTLAPLHPLVTAGAPRTGSRVVGRGRSLQKAGMQPMTSVALGAGIEPWWTYEARTIPGIGKAMLNVGTGNMVVSAVDVDVHEQGIDLAFQRVYNTQSQHDYNGDDGGDRAIFGNYWTNNFDANMVYDSVANTITVYDIDGTPCTYTAVSGQWVACTGVYAKLAPVDPNTDCNYTWTKPNGTVYLFYADVSAGGCGLPQAKKGHLQEIVGRNNNNTITFSYSYNGQAKGSEDVTEIDATHSDGHILKMFFGLIAGTSINELAQIQRPGNSNNNTLQYLYDTSGNLVEVDRPGNDASATLPETYAYVPGTSYIQEACGPRCTLSTRANPNGIPTDGSALLFTYNNNNWVNSFQVYGVLNIDPNDGYGILQKQQSNGRTWSNVYTANFIYGTGNRCTYASAGTTTMCDSDNHSTIWTANTVGSITQTQRWTGVSEGLMLVTNATWDSNNNLVETIDANGNKTDYAYNISGDTIAVARPRPATGQDRPTSLYAYDSYHNIQSYCDPVYSSQNGLDWNSGSYTGSGCPGGPGTTHYQWSSSSAEPFGYMTDVWTACFNANCTDHFNAISEPGYHISFAYTPFGLPQSIVGDNIHQGDDPTTPTRAPTQSFMYDGRGNLTSYSKAGGTWILNYDSLNRITSRVDPDPGAPTTYTSYNPDGSVSLTETPYQHSLNEGHAFTYDTDGDMLTQTVHRNGTTGKITKAYDGLDRLVEVQEPYSSANDVYTNPWITRYFYDLSQGSTESFNSPTQFYAYGNLYTTEELLPSGGSSVNYTGTPPHVSNQAFEPTKGAQYDALDRATGGYSIVSGSNALESRTYDETGQLGMLYQDCLPIQTMCKTYAYDDDNRTTAISYSDGNSQSYTYDPSNHVLTATNNDGSLTSWYDLEGRVVNRKEPNNGTSPATYTHEFYADGKMKQLDVSSSALTRNNGLFTYSYSNTGDLEVEDVTYTPQNVNIAVTFGYTPAGRLTSRSESGSGANSNPTTMTYDTYGQLIAVKYPQQSQVQNFQYNPEGELLSFGNPNSGPTQTFAYTIRGDLLPSGPGGGNPLFGNPGSFVLGNGAQVQTASGIGILNYSSTWDDRMGAMSSLAINTNTDPQTQTSFSYDAAGRQTGSGSNNCSDSSCDTQIISGTGRQYDVANHTTSATQSWQLIKSAGGSASANVSVYDWGPSDHPIKIGSADSTTSTPPPASAAAYDTLHWDGDQLIFTTNAQVNVDDIKVGSSGDITPLDSNFKGITFWDRGPGGAVVYCHNASGSGGSGTVATYPFLTMWSSSPCLNGSNQSGTFPNSVMWFDGPTAVGTVNGKPRVGGVGQGGVLGMYRPDGISDGANTIQGVRMTDATSGIWTTPDAFAGVINDPKTQKPYMWSGNDPLSYSDPNGYAINGSAFCDCGGGVSVGGTECSANGCSLPPDDGGNAGATAVASAPCAATYSGACYQAGQTLPIQDPNNWTYGSAGVTDKALSSLTSTVTLGPDGEIGAAVACEAATGPCGHGDIVVGDNNNVGVDISQFKGYADQGVTIWHEHPPGSLEDSTSDHNDNNNQIRSQNPWLGGKTLIISTEYGGATYTQTYAGYVPSGYYNPPVPIP